MKMKVNYDSYLKFYEENKENNKKEIKIKTPNKLKEFREISIQLF